MRRSLGVFAVTVFLSLICAAQPSPAPLAFEVAAIKPNNSGSNATSEHSDNDTILMTNASLRMLVQRAYDVHDDSCVAPAWLASTHFDITAKAPGHFDYRLQFRPMLRTLLAERFKLAVHHENKTVSGYALVRMKGDLKFQEVEAGNGDTNSSGRRGHYDAKRVTMQMLADFIRREVGDPVVDQTGLAGIYQLKLDYTPENNQPRPDGTPAPESEGPSIFTAVQEQLGLKLVRQKVTVDILVVDHIEKTPTEN